ncbi:MAG: LysR family transcriptional regulator [Actinomycetota bacterium]|nr:LysR family transcriptional regulator [Actinomycetota bacterium]
MELRQLQYVIAVADTGNFTRAAERCLVVQPAISQQIHRLEKELGVRLFDRTSRNVRLTAAGEAFLPVARQILAQVDHARSEVAAVAGAVRGRMVIGTVQTLLFVDLLHLFVAYHAEHPGVEVTLLEGVSENLIRQVRARDLDLAFVALTNQQQAEGLGCHLILREDLVAVTATDSQIAPGDTVSLERLAEESFIDFSAGSGLRNQTDQAFRAAGLIRRVVFEVTSIDKLAELTALGLGITLLPRSNADDLTNGINPRHRQLSIPEGPQRSVCLVWATPPTPAARAFIELFRLFHEPPHQGEHTRSES